MLLAPTLHLPHSLRPFGRKIAAHPGYLASSNGAGKQSRALAMQPSAETGYQVDDLVIDIGRQRVSRGDTQLPLSALSFELLLALTRAAPNLLTFDQLIDQVWPGIVVSPETVSQRVKVVREALGDDAQKPRYIAGIRSRGYRMLATVRPWAERAPETQPAPSHVVVGPVAAPATSAAAADLTSPLSPTVPSAEIPRASHRGHVMAALAVIATVVIGWLLYSYLREPATSPPQGPGERTSVLVTQPPRTIAVLPLLDISPHGGNDYLGDGLAEELSTRLARIPGLRVAAQTSAFAFKGQRTDIRQIAQSLGVRNVLEGSVRRDGGQLRVTARLIDAQSGYNVWSQTYDRPWQDLLAIQDDVAHSIIDALQLVLSSDVMARLGQQPTSNLAAFDLYLTGLAHLRRNKATAEAEQSFREALALDPHFARAYAGLCEAYATAYENARDTAIASKAEAACAKALSLDASLLEVERALGHLYVISGRSARAIEIYRSAVAKNPQNADAHIGLARAYEEQRHTAEAEATYQRAIEAEPDYWGGYNALGGFLMQQGKAAEAVTQYQQVVKLAPANPSGLNNLGAALQMTGNFEAAAKAFERSLALEPTRSAYSNTGTMYYYLGRFPDAVRMFRKATERSPEDHRVWGNLADALFAMKDEREPATRTYGHAMELAERELAVNPKDAITAAQVAHYYARSGNKPRARSYIARALDLRPDVVWVQYYAALVSLEIEGPNAALDAVSRTVQLGYPPQLMRNAPEFAALRGDPRFQKMLLPAKNNPSQ